MPDITAVAEPAITIAICTHNNCEVLDGALASLFGMRMPLEATIEVLVVDNASEDGTRDVARQYANLYPRIVRYVSEPTLGLSNARNRALCDAQGQIIAVVDDDVLFDCEWLAATLRAFANEPGVDCLGGRTRLAFERDAPLWLTPYLSSVYGIGVDDPAPRHMLFPEHPYGLNMAFRRSVFERVGGFNSRLGRSGKKLLSSEEAGTVFAHRQGRNQDGLRPTRSSCTGFRNCEPGFRGSSRAIFGATCPGQSRMDSRVS